MNSTQLQAELSSLEKRRGELTIELATTDKQLANAREGLVEGSTTVATVTKLQSTSSALAMALDELTNRIEAKQQELDVATKKENDEALMVELSELAKAATEKAGAFSKAHLHACGIMGEMLQGLFAGHDEWRLAQFAFMRRALEGIPGHQDRAERADQILADLEEMGVDVTALKTGSPSWTRSPSDVSGWPKFTSHEQAGAVSMLFYNKTSDRQADLMKKVQSG